MSQVDRTELNELRERVQGAAADRAIISKQLASALARTRELEGELEAVTNHRNRLLRVQEALWTGVFAEDGSADGDVRASGDPAQQDLPLPGDPEC